MLFRKRRERKRKELEQFFYKEFDPRVELEIPLSYEISSNEAPKTIVNVVLLSLIPKSMREKFIREGKVIEVDGYQFVKYRYIDNYSPRRQEEFDFMQKVRSAKNTVFLCGGERVKPMILSA